MRKRAGPRRGASMIWMAMLSIVFIALIGLTSDTGYAFLVAHQLHNAADAAALAGSRQLTYGHDAVRQATVQAGAANSAAKAPVQMSPNAANDAAGDIVLGRYNRGTRTFTPTLESPNAVMAVARRTDGSPNGPLSLIFGPAFGVSTVNIERSAVAINQGSTGAAMVALCGDCECALKVTGSGNVVANGGPLQVNSTDPCAVCGNGNFQIDSVGVNVGGGVCTNPAGRFPGDIWSGAPPVSDPLAHIPEPTWDPAADLGTIDTSGTFGPGYYSGGLNLTDSTYTQTATLLPGIYILDGAGINIKSDTILLAEGVMLYIPPGTGSVDIAGTGSFHLTPPDPALYSYPGVDTYEYISMFQSRQNFNPSRIIGTGLLDIAGTLYFPSADLEIGGEGDGFGNQLIANTIWVHGTGDIVLNYEGSFPGLGGTVFLVE